MTPMEQNLSKSIFFKNQYFYIFYDDKSEKLPKKQYGVLRPKKNNPSILHFSSLGGYKCNLEGPNTIQQPGAPMSRGPNEDPRRLLKFGKPWKSSCQTLGGWNTICTFEKRDGEKTQTNTKKCKLQNSSGAPLGWALSAGERNYLTFSGEKISFCIILYINIPFIVKKNAKITEIDKNLGLGGKSGTKKRSFS